MSTISIYAQVKLVSLYLAFVQSTAQGVVHLNGCPHVALQRITSDTREYVQEPVVPNSRQERLFVRGRIPCNQTRGGIGHLYHVETRPGQDKTEWRQTKAVNAFPGREYHPLPTCWGKRRDAFRQWDPVTE